MKVLIISSEVPYPPTHGGARLKLFELLKYLSQFHELTLFTLLDSEEERAYLPHLQTYCRVDVFLRPDLGTRPTWRDYLRAGYWRMRYSPAMATAVRAEFANNRYDLVHVDTGFVAMYVRDLPAMPRLLATHDCLTLVKSSQISHAPTALERAKRIWWTWMVRRYEQQLYPQYHGCVVVAQPDADALAQLCPGLPVWVVPSGVDTDYYAPQGGAEQDEQLVFTGSMEYEPNEDAVIHFVHDILPIIRRSLPNVHFTIVGRNPTSAVSALQRQPGVSVTGFVNDLRPHVHRASVYVCPLRQGAGMKNKMLEALAMGKAIVATRAAASGLGVRDGRELRLCEDDASFAAVVVELMRDAAQRRRLGAQARAYVLEQHGWEQTGRLMNTAYQQTVAIAGGHCPQARSRPTR